jgi:hypothetical protein
MVRTGDQPVLSVSRQIAPYQVSVSVLFGNRLCTYRDTGHVGVPDLGEKPHDGWLEGVFVRNGDINLESAAFVWSSGRASERALKFSDAVANRIDIDVRDRIRLDVRQLFRDSSRSVPGHAYGRASKTRFVQGLR